MSTTESRSTDDESSTTESRATGIDMDTESPDLPVALAAGASVLYSWYTFYVREDEMYGLFIGLWPPTLLAFAEYLRSRE